MHKNYKKIVLVFLLAALVPGVALITALFAYDPLQVFHAAWGRPSTVHDNMRLQTLGVIKRARFDSVILGSSVFENTSADEAGRLLGGRFVNLSISAGDFYERSLMLNYMLSHRHVKNIIYSMDFIYLNQKKGYRVFPLESFDFLYDKNPLNDVRVYLNEHFLRCLVTWSHSEDCVGRVVSLDRPNSWMNDPEYSRRFGGLSKWCENKNNYQIQDVYKKISDAAYAITKNAIERPNKEEIKAKLAAATYYIDDNLLSLARQYPGTDFYLVFPPYSRAKFSIWYQDRISDAEVHLGVVRYLVEESMELNNIHIYGFENEAFLDDVANYKDMDHFGPGINSYLLESIAANRNRIFYGNLDDYLKIARENGERYDLVQLSDRLGSCINADKN